MTLLLNHFLLALSSMRHHPMRAALTLVGIVIGIVALVVMISLTEALMTDVKSATDPLGAGVFQVQQRPRWSTRRLTGQDGRSRKAFTLQDLDQIRSRVAKSEIVAGEMWMWRTRAHAGRHSTDPVCATAGAMPGFLESNGIELDAGRFLTAQDLRQERPVVVIGADLVDRLFSGRAELALGSRIRVKAQIYTVIGTLKKRPTLFGGRGRNALIVMPITVFRRQHGFRSLHITFVPREGEQTQRAMSEAIGVIRNQRGVPPGAPNDFEIFNNSSLSGYIDALAVAVGSASLAVCLLALLVGGVGVMNIMLVSVTERTAEIGLRKAVGASAWAIRGQFLSEAMTLTAVGGLVGVALAVVGVNIAAHILEVPAKVPVWAAVLGVASSTGVGLLFGIYPADRAARLHPIESLRYE